MVNTRYFDNDGYLLALSANQLSEMASEPYWHVSLRNKSAPPRWKVLDPAIAANPSDYGYGVEWVAYAYPPINVDDIPSCGECRSCGNCIYDGMSGYVNPCFSCMESDDMKCFRPVAYCRRCGKPLTTEARAILMGRLGGLESRLQQEMYELIKDGIMQSSPQPGIVSEQSY